MRRRRLLLRTRLKHFHSPINSGEAHQERIRKGGPMPSISNEVFQWLDRAEQAREVAGQLNDPSARKAVVELAESFERLARAAAPPNAARRRELATQEQERS